MSDRHNPFGGPAFDPTSDPRWRHAYPGATAGAGENPLQTPLGDATRWGSRGALTITTPAVTVADQVISVATKDPYARNWQIVGNIGASALAWLLAPAAFTIGMEVVMGVGQGGVTVVYDLQALIAQADPFYQQRFNNFQRMRPFVIGGLVGHTINARLLFQIPGLIPPANLPVLWEATIGPYSAGSGI